jgi:hypothetical protein
MTWGGKIVPGFGRSGVGGFSSLKRILITSNENLPYL